MQQHQSASHELDSAVTRWRQAEANGISATQHIQSLSRQLHLVDEEHKACLAALQQR